MVDRPGFFFNGMEVRCYLVRDGRKGLLGKCSNMGLITKFYEDCYFRTPTSWSRIQYPCFWEHSEQLAERRLY
jgi:hypothetical protein